MIPTYITREETEELHRLAAGATVLELGAQFGYSTVWLAQVARVVYSCDWHYGDPQAGERNTLSDWAGNTESLRRAGKVIGLLGRFDSVLPLLQPASFELIFHDGYHEAAAMRQDLRMALPLLSWGGAFCAHDWGLFGVSEALEPVLGAPTRVVGRLAVWANWSGRWCSAGA